MKRLLFVLIVLMPAAAARAQAPATPPPNATVNVEMDPIRCWWRTSTAAVQVGETFELWLTCATLENESVQVVPDQSHLGLEVVSLAPFEVVGGSHPADLRSGQRRFFQYQYILRVINPDVIGHDVALPDTVIHYKVNSRVAENTSLQGRDLMYVLPEEYVRVSSLVPPDATDIRDSPGESFGIIETLGLRAGMLEIVAITCVVLGSLMVLFVLVRLLGRVRKRTPADERMLGPRSIIGAAIRELGAVQRAREQQGWSQELAGRALAASRIAAACAIGRPVSQRLRDATNTDRAGRLVASGAMRGKPTVLSSPVTADDLKRHQAAAPPSDARRQLTLDDLSSALATFTAAQYGRDAALDESALDSALSSARSAAGRVKTQYAWGKTAFRQLIGGGATAESRA